MFIKAIRGVTLVLILVVMGAASFAAPYAALVMDARTGEVLHSRNADTELHPASLTKMMTLYIVFTEVEAGRMSLDQKITISSFAASQPPSKLGLRAGQTIALRYLIRAAAVKSANDAATALAEAVSGTEPAFAQYMTSTARALGMSNTTFKNAHGLTAPGHLSTARDMATLGRRLFYDFPDYYNLFSRITTETTVKTVYNTNRAFLGSYEGADGIKTGYTRAAGFNLVASAQRGEVRIIAAMFGGTSTPQRNAQVAKLLDMGFDRADSQVAVIRPPAVTIVRPGNAVTRDSGVVLRTQMPILRGGVGPAVLMARNIDDLVTTVVVEESIAETIAQEVAAQNAAIEDIIASDGMRLPLLRPTEFKPAPEVASIDTETAIEAAVSAISEPEHVFGDWAVQIGVYSNRTNTDKLLVTTALMDLAALQGATRRVEVTQVQGVTMYRAMFVGLAQTDAEKACLRLIARGAECQVVGPSD